MWLERGIQDGRRKLWFGDLEQTSTGTLTVDTIKGDLSLVVDVINLTMMLIFTVLAYFY